MNFLLGIAIALITLDETQVSCGIIVGKVTNMFYLQLKKQMHFLQQIESVNIFILASLKLLNSRLYVLTNLNSERKNFCRRINCEFAENTFESTIYYLEVVFSKRTS
jgi:hypothetical protein